MGKIDITGLLEPCVDPVLLRRAWPEGPDGARGFLQSTSNLDVRDVAGWALALYDLAEAIDGKSETRWEVTLRPVPMDDDRKAKMLAWFTEQRVKLETAASDTTKSDVDHAVVKNLLDALGDMPAAAERRLATHSLYELKIRGVVVMTTSFAFPTKSLATALVLARIKAREEL
jgi:hypothetical protein